MIIIGYNACHLPLCSPRSKSISLSSFELSDMMKNVHNNINIFMVYLPLSFIGFLPAAVV